MSSTTDVAVLVGSLREASINLRVAKALQSLAPADLRLEIVPIGDLPHYNQDLEKNVPPAWERFRTRIEGCDAVVFVTPEHNRSIPSVLKNAIEVGSRPFGKSVWERKPGAVTGASPGLLGGSAAALHLRQILANINVAALPQPEVYLSGADKLFDENGVPASTDTAEFLRNFLRAFSEWIGKLA